MHIARNVISTSFYTALFLLFATPYSSASENQIPDDAEPQTTKSYVSIADDTVITTTSSGDSNEAEFVPGEIIVKFKSRSHANEAVANHRSPKGNITLPSVPALGKLFDRFNVRHGAKPFRHAKGVAPTDPRRLTVLFSAPGLASIPARVTELLTALRQLPQIEYAELNPIMQTQLVPDDPYYSSSATWGQTFQDLWGLQKIQAETAWDLSQGSNVIVAVIDTGIDYNHSDLSSNIWTNSGEIAGNGIDDDNNGFIDDDSGWDFVSFDNDPLDDHGHGTHTSGTIAAVGNNNLGIIGVAPQAKIMGLKGLNQNGGGSTADLSSAIYYAADNGADVINASWGGFGTTPQTLIDAISYAHDQKDAAFVAAAGNFNVDVGSETYGFFPANIRDVITVAAGDHLDTKASFSNHGVKIDVLAPGGGDTDANGLVIQPDRSILSLKSEVANASMAVPALIIDTDYLRQSGTSMAAPHVTGTVALVRALRPTLSAEEVRQVIRRSSDDVGTVGFDSESGYGRLNATQALLDNGQGVAQITYTGGDTLSGSIPIEISGNAHSPNLTAWRLEYGAGTSPSLWTEMTSGSTPVIEGVLDTWDFSVISDGKYTVRLIVEDSFGYANEDRITLTIDQIDFSSPGNNAPFKGGDLVTISGTVSPALFSSYTIKMTKSDGTYLDDNGITLANDGLEKVVDGMMGTIDTTTIPTDLYRLELRVNLTDGRVLGVYMTALIVDQAYHTGWPQNLGSVSTYTLALMDHLTVADMNGDGGEELIVSYGNSIRIFDHSGVFLPGWPQSIDPDGQGHYTQRGTAVGDLTGDGIPEIVASSSASNIFIWEADGTLLPGWPKKISSDHFSINDINGDGVNEVVGTQGPNVRIYDKDGNYLPGWPKWNLTPNILDFFGQPAVGDVDYDGNKEIAVFTQNNVSELYLLSFDGNVMPGWPITINPDLGTRWVYNYPVMADLDNDTDLEIIIGSTDGTVYAFHHDGSNVAGWPQTTRGTAISTAAIGDIDGDGSVEIIVGNDTVNESNEYFNYLYAWHGDGSPVAGWPVIYDRTIRYTSWGFGAPVLADITSDGRPDIIVSSDVGYFNERFALNAYQYDGTKVPGFPKPTANVTAWGTNTAAVADIDNDGLQEVAWIDLNLNLYVWDTAAVASSNSPWPMFHHDAAHTGRQPSTVESPNRLPVLNSIGPQSADEGALLSFTISGSDPDNDPLTFSATELPIGASFDAVTQTFAWIPNYTQAGAFTVTFTASDGTLSDFEQVSITVNEMPGATVITTTATGVEQTQANLNGTVNPNGSATNAWFEWGTTTSYGNATMPQPLGNGNIEANIASVIVGLSKNTTYHFRMVGESAAGIELGIDQSFTTLPDLPVVVTGAATGIRKGEATLHGTITPNGASGSVWFEYGIDTSYGSLTSVQSASGYQEVAINNVISGLTSKTTYHFRIAGQNGDGGSVTYGADSTFYVKSGRKR